MAPTPVRPSARPFLLLKLLGGELPPEEWEIEGVPVGIGRLDDSDITLPHRSVSRHHARIVPTANGYEVEDLGSTNGTWLNDRPLSDRTTLSDGDSLMVGDITLVVELLQPHRQGQPDDFDVPQLPAGPEAPPAGGASTVFYELDAALATARPAEPAPRLQPAQPPADYQRVQADESPTLVGEIPVEQFQTPSTATQVPAEISAGAEGKPAEHLAPASERLVNTGFATSDTAQTLGSDIPLRPGQQYMFWLEVGPAVEGSIETHPEPIPAEHLPAGATLHVALFGFEGELRPTEGADVGELELLPDGLARVLRQPGDLAWTGATNRRLCFPITTPELEGTHRLRCCIYHRGLLVQSRLVHARVSRQPGSRDRALRSTVDYTLSRSLEYTTTERHRLSLLFNDNEDGTHGLRIFGLDGKELFKHEATLLDGQLAKAIELARSALRIATWGDKNPYARHADGHFPEYRYGGKPDRERLRLDLIRMALYGVDLYDTLINPLAGGARKAAEELRKLLRSPARVQIALKQFAQRVIPAAMFYDYPLDTGLYGEHGLARYNLCPTFSAALDGPVALAETVCFQGMCPNAEAPTIVCPGGFWGFRHMLGLPYSIGAAPDLPPAIRFAKTPDVLLGVSTDQTLQPALGEHLTALRALRPDAQWHHADERQAMFDLMIGTRPQLVYFFCHAGYDRRPWIRVGAPDGPDIVPPDLRRLPLDWDTNRPLIFINGCRSTALEPEQLRDFVTAFLEQASASGVIGTEVSIFPALAKGFAEAALRGFLHGQPIGDAVRQARLELLKAGNPLGLVYVPFVVSTMSVVGSAQGGGS